MQGIFAGFLRLLREYGWRSAGPASAPLMKAALYSPSFRAVFDSVLIVNLRFLWLCVCTLCDWFRNIRHFFNKRVRPKPRVTCLESYALL